MCGLTGFCDFNKKMHKAEIEKATEVLYHRGPDSGNSEVFISDTATIGFGHRRLSILDVSSNGNQPMYSDDKSVVIILNGEIYNFKEIREELISLGYKFHSDSDTEVVVKAYQAFGISSVHKFIGMFAYAIYDKKKEVIYLLRDRPGIKPLYYYYKNDRILFASELKSFYTYPEFQKNIDRKAVSLFFQYGYIRAPYTIFKDTFKVKPGYYIKIDLKSKEVKEEKYYDVLDYYNKPKLRISEEEAVEETERLFISAFQYRMVSDVPVGMFLSGGYDSSIVSAVLQKHNTQKIKTFTIGFHEQQFNEAPFAKKIAEYLGTDHNEYYCTTKEAQDILPLIPGIYDEPFGDSSAIPTILVSQFARKQVTVSLSADGGDEIFAGYTKHQRLVEINNVFQKSPKLLLKSGKIVSNATVGLLPGLKRVHKIARAQELFNSYNTNGLTEIYNQNFSNQEMERLLKDGRPAIGLYDDIGKLNCENDFVNRCLALDYYTYMIDDILVKVDRATMSVSLEGREPLLDHRIIEFVSQLPSEMKLKNGEKKYLLKKIAHKYIPKELLDRPKAGFTIPMNEWLRSDLKHYLMNYINEEKLSQHGYLNNKKAILVRDEFLSGKKRRETQVWLILMFQMWWEKWMK
ncbi:MAG TPA: asparagine synthase (glutamine-hydrolyzing) [Chitinophagaceae bacterium]|nr:asparagine synthase (glutamine-hydrolyzing) [Chitinophagaceae bacterium]